MISSTNCSANRRLRKICLFALAILGCASAQARDSLSTVIPDHSGMNTRIAVMPVGNLTGIPVPVDAVRRSIVQSMARQRFDVLGDDVLESFLERHRVRFTGGINRELGKALREETGAEAVLFFTLEQFEEDFPPKVALSARMVSSGGGLEILWADSVGMSGNDHPGFLLLGLVGDPAVLWERAKSRVLGSLERFLSGEGPGAVRPLDKRFAPKSFHGVSPKLPGGKKTVSIAILPFENDSARRNAGDIMPLHFTREFSRGGNIGVIESGEVRQALLQTRTIMEGGLSLPQADVLRAALDADLVLTGIVTEYRDAFEGETSPRVEFSARVFDMETRQIVWTSSSYNEGDDGVFFFDAGRKNSAHEVASEMVRSVVARMQATMKAK